MPTTMRNSILNLLSAIISMASGFGAAVVVARLMGAEGAGVTAFGFWLASCASVICDRGYPQGILRFAAHGQGNISSRSIIRDSFKRFIPLVGVAFLGACIMILATNEVSADLDVFVWLAVAVLFLVYSLSNFSLAASRGSGDFHRPARNTILGSILFLPLSAIGALLIGPAGALLALAARYLPQALQLTTLIPRQAPVDTDKGEGLDQEFRSYRHQMWINDVISIIALSRLEYLFLLILATKADMGYFAVAIAFAGLVEQLAMQLSSPLVVSFSHASKTTTRGAWLGVALLFVPISMGGSAIAPLLVPLVYGEAFSETGTAAAIMLLAGGVSALAIVPWTYLAAKGHAVTLTRVMIISALVTSIAAPIAILTAGVHGLAWSRLFVESVILAILIHYAVKKENMGRPLRLLGGVLASGLACGLTALATIHWMPTILGMVIAMLIGAMAFALMLKVTGSVPRAELAQLLDLIDRRHDSRMTRSLRHGLFWISRA